MLARLKALALGVALAALPGCIGLLYRHTTEPLDVDFNRTPVAATKDGQGDVKEIRYYVGVSWDSNGIGDIAKARGIKTVYFADMETLSLFLGIWTQRTVHIYGE
jgi:TRL (tRNA-associated locus)-like protein